MSVGTVLQQGVRKLFTNQTYWWCGLLIVVVFFSFYNNLGSYYLLNNNEGLYAGIAKYMLSNKSYIIPSLNCVPYIEKPPLLYWLLAFSFSLFGFNAFAARFVTATSALLLCLVLLYFVKKLKSTKIAILSSLIFASSIGISVISRMVYFDMLNTLLISTSLFCLFYWHVSQRVNVLRVAYILLGLAILTKGLIAIVLVGGSFCLFLVLDKSLFKTVCKLLDYKGIILFLIIVLPWHIAAAIQHKNFLWNYIIGEHVLRFLSLREPHDYYHGPIYYYLLRLPIYLFPWSFFAPVIFLRNKIYNSCDQRLLRFCWSWVIVPLVFFSLSSAKANYYMVVSMPALAIILGIKLNSWFESSKKPFFNVLVAMFLFMILVLSLILFHTNLSTLFSISVVNLINKAVIGLVFWILLAMFFLLIFNKWPQIGVIVLSSLIIPISIMSTKFLAQPEISETISTANTGIYLSQYTKNEQLYLYQDFENISALSFYANSCFKVIDSKSNDLYYGSHLLESKKWFITSDGFLKELSKPDKTYYITIPTKKLDQFYEYIKPIRLTKHLLLQKNKDCSIMKIAVGEKDKN